MTKVDNCPFIKKGNGNFDYIWIDNTEEIGKRNVYWRHRLTANETVRLDETVVSDGTFKDDIGILVRI